MADRELLKPKGGQKRFIRRDANGRFEKGQVDVGRSLAEDVRKPAGKAVQSGQGDRGDQKKRS
jgi:hypothetical protein